VHRAAVISNEKRCLFSDRCELSNGCAACHDDRPALRHLSNLFREIAFLAASTDQHLTAILGRETVGQLRKPLRRPGLEPVTSAGLQDNKRLRPLNIKLIQQLIRTVLLFFCQPQLKIL
jgi:hypothetical protein